MPSSSFQFEYTEQALESMLFEMNAGASATEHACQRGPQEQVLQSMLRKMSAGASATEHAFREARRSKCHRACVSAL